MCRVLLHDLIGWLFVARRAQRVRLGFELFLFLSIGELGRVVALGGGEPTDAFEEMKVALDDLNDVFVVEKVLETDSLTVVLGTGAPDEGVLELLGELGVELRAKVLDCNAAASVAQNDGFLKVSLLSHLFRVHTHESHGVPDALEEVIHAQVHVARDAHRIWSSAQTVHLFNGQRVNLVVDVQTPYVLSIPL